MCCLYMRSEIVGLCFGMENCGFAGNFGFVGDRLEENFCFGVVAGFENSDS